MSAEIFWSALALVLVIEGILPFVSPGGWRRGFGQLMQLRDGQLRFVGLCSILLGLFLLGVLGSGLPPIKRTRLMGGRPWTRSR